MLGQVFVLYSPSKNMDAARLTAPAENTHERIGGRRTSPWGTGSFGRDHSGQSGTSGALHPPKPNSRRRGGGAEKEAPRQAP